MSLLVFNTEENLGEFEKFKLLPDELQNHIGKYVDEIYNEIWNYTNDWYHIIDNIGFNYGWEFLIDFLNKHLTEKTTLLTQELDCRKRIGYSHTCVEFITCDEKLSVGFYYDYIKMHPGRRYIWEDDLVDSTKATELIMDKLNEYLYSDKYDPTVMYKINKRLLDEYDYGDFDDDDWQ